MPIQLIEEHGGKVLILHVNGRLVKADYEHFADIDRLAMVGDRQWQQSMAIFCKLFMQAKSDTLNAPMSTRRGFALHFMTDFVSHPVRENPSSTGTYGNQLQTDDTNTDIQLDMFTLLTEH